MLSSQTQVWGAEAPRLAGDAVAAAVVRHHPRHLKKKKEINFARHASGEGDSPCSHHRHKPPPSERSSPSRVPPVPPSPGCPCPSTPPGLGPPRLGSRTRAPRSRAARMAAPRPASSGGQRVASASKRQQREAGHSAPPPGHGSGHRVSTVPLCAAARPAALRALGRPPQTMASSVLSLPVRCSAPTSGLFSSAAPASPPPYTNASAPQSTSGAHTCGARRGENVKRALREGAPGGRRRRSCRQRSACDSRRRRRRARLFEGRAEVLVDRVELHGARLPEGEAVGGDVGDGEGGDVPRGQDDGEAAGAAEARADGVGGADGLPCAARAGAGGAGGWWRKGERGRGGDLPSVRRKGTTSFRVLARRARSKAPRGTR